MIPSMTRAPTRSNFATQLPLPGSYHNYAITKAQDQLLFTELPPMQARKTDIYGNA